MAVAKSHEKGLVVRLFNAILVLVDVLLFFRCCTETATLQLSVSFFRQVFMHMQLNDTW